MHRTLVGAGAAQSRDTRTLLAAASGLALAWAFSVDAAAQAPAPDDVDAIVVTASRAGRSGFSAPTPTVVVGADAIKRQGASNVLQVLDQIPAFKSTLNRSTQGGRIAQTGGAAADLRGLGPQRTLVLVNGMRVVPVAPANTAGALVAADMNQVPSLLIDHIDVVTGGVGAQWGSDAMAGVVNIMLKTKFEGVELTAQFGQSFRGDATEYRVGGLVGFRFAGERGHVVAGFDYVKDGKIGDIYTRDWGRRESGIVTNSASATNGLPVNILADGVHASISNGGLIAGPANFSLRNNVFQPGGQTLAPFRFGSVVAGTFQIGGEGRSLSQGVWMAPKIERANPYIHIDYDLGPRTTAFLEGGYSYGESQLSSVTSRDTGLVIRNDNAFLPASVVAAMAAANISQFTLNRANYDIHRAFAVNSNKAFRLAGGLKGEVGGWSWDAHYSHAENVYVSDVAGSRIKQNFTYAIDAVRSGGQIVCRATLPGAGFAAAAAGCVPLNLFGEGSPSPAAIGYVVGTAHSQARYKQDAAAANIRGEPFSTWGGPVSLAAGLEYRRESEVVTADPIAAVAGYDTGNATPFQGEFDVKEAYVETIVPLARDQAWVRSFELNAAYRIADYSTAGGQSTWKIGATYEPVPGLRFRATRSRDIRAPALYELFGKGSVTNSVINVRGLSSVASQNVAIGSPDLKPEKGDTLTLGMVVEPRGALRGLRASLDYYDIDIADAIASPSGQQIASLCTLGQQAFCNLITFGPTGAALAVNAGVRNAAKFNAVGFDAVISYVTSLSRIHPDWGGDLTFTLSGTRVQHAWIDFGTGTGPIDRAGENSQINFGAVPRFRSNFSITYSNDGSSFTAQVSQISKGTIDNTFNTSAATTANVNRVPALAYLSLYARHYLSKAKTIEAFAGMTNVFDQKPANVPNVTFNVATNGSYYDIVGRAFQLGVTFKH